MSKVIEDMLKNYSPKTKSEYECAIQEILQELSLMGLWRANFFEHAAFYGGTSLRILHGLARFSEDLDFSLLKPDLNFDLDPFLKAVEEELSLSGLQVTITTPKKTQDTTIRSAFLKVGTLETFLRIGLDPQLQKHTQANEVLKLKVEIDIDPPLGFQTEIQYLTNPFPFSVRTYVPEDLFAGKMHALLCRPYKIRVKGRDWYDLIWYLSKGFSLHLSHLEMRMRQSGHYKDKEPLTKETFLKLFEDKIEKLDIEAAKEDLWRFIRSPREIEGWSKPFFQSLTHRFLFSD